MRHICVCVIRKAIILYNDNTKNKKVIIKKHKYIKSWCTCNINRYINKIYFVKVNLITVYYKEER